MRHTVHMFGACGKAGLHIAGNNPCHRLYSQTRPNHLARVRPAWGSWLLDKVEGSPPRPQPAQDSVPKGDPSTFVEACASSPALVIPRYIPGRSAGHGPNQDGPRHVCPCTASSTSRADNGGELLGKQGCHHSISSMLLNRWHQ